MKSEASTYSSNDGLENINQGNESGVRSFARADYSFEGETGVYIGMLTDFLFLYYHGDMGDRRQANSIPTQQADADDSTDPKEVEAAKETLGKAQSD